MSRVVPTPNDSPRAGEERATVTGDPAEKTPQRVPLPAGYRQGVISAITVLLGFSLLFLRYWSFEAEGEWTLGSFVATGLLGLAIGLELVALWRSSSRPSSTPEPWPPIDG